jgi:hypothetical protein
MNLLARSSRRKADSQKLADVSAKREVMGLEVHFLERLTRLGHTRMEAYATLDGRQRRLLDHALYSTYWDCVNLGLRKEARRIVGALSQASPGPSGCPPRLIPRGQPPGTRMAC